MSSANRRCAGDGTKEDLDVVLKCASYAPSAMNAQNWHFTAIQEAKLMEKLNGWIVTVVVSTETLERRRYRLVIVSSKF